MKSKGKSIEGGLFSMQSENEMIQDAINKGARYVTAMIIIFGLCVVLSGYAVLTLDNQWVLLQTLLFLNFVTFFSNMIIFVVSLRTILFAFRAEFTIDSGAQELAETVQKFKDAGMTADEVNKMKPMVSEVSRIVDNVPSEKMHDAITKLIYFLNSRYDKDIEKPDIDDVEV